MKRSDSPRSTGRRMTAPIWRIRPGQGAGSSMDGPGRDASVPTCRCGRIAESAA
jgi:hypothetical protein